ncbi:hypothetical protein T439DRAFT_97370 [Meredithblackwellia eburnea MCA 4105]
MLQLRRAYVLLPPLSLPVGSFGMGQEYTGGCSLGGLHGGTAAGCPTSERATTEDEKKTTPTRNRARTWWCSMSWNRFSPPSCLGLLSFFFLLFRIYGHTQTTSLLPLQTPPRLTLPNTLPQSFFGRTGGRGGPRWEGKR